jgi:hypothetical protein
MTAWWIISPDVYPSNELTRQRGSGGFPDWRCRVTVREILLDINTSNDFETPFSFIVKFQGRTA